MLIDDELTNRLVVFKDLAIRSAHHNHAMLLDAVRDLWVMVHMPSHLYVYQEHAAVWRRLWEAADFPVVDPARSQETLCSP